VLFRQLAIPDAFGGILGVYFPANVPRDTIRPFVNACLLIPGMTTMPGS